MPTGEEEDGPFQVDARVAPLLVVEPAPYSSSDDGTQQSNNNSTCFGLVLVALWPATDRQRRQLLEGYRRLCAATELCFDETDVPSSSTRRQHYCSKHASPPPAPVYVYPFTALHVTIATLHAFFAQPPVASEERQRTLTEQWNGVVQKARQMEQWPIQPLQLTIDGARMGERAGIVLWKETTGGLDKMRRCLAETVAQPETVAELQRHGVDVGTLSMPTNGIVHSTFARFCGRPAAPADAVRQRFRATVRPRLREFFSHGPVRCDEVRLARESAPYMHQSAEEEDDGNNNNNTVAVVPLASDGGGSLLPEDEATETTDAGVLTADSREPKEEAEEQHEPFVVDPRVAHLVEPPFVNNNVAETTFFGLTLVTAWPLSRVARSQLLEPYYRLCALTELCFDFESDVARRNNEGIAPVYLYPFAALHISVAVLHDAFIFQQQDAPGGEKVAVPPKERQSILEAAWLNVVEQAAALPGWPRRQPLRLQFDHAVLGHRAGRLVWRETTGGLSAMRHCLRTICSRPAIVVALARDDIAVPESLMAVPDDGDDDGSVAHTTFLRFYARPRTPAATVRERFAKTVAPQLPGIFSDPIAVPDARLIRERAPCMHNIPVEESTVRTFPFGSAQNSTTTS